MSELCRICGVMVATRGNYCERCLEIEFSSLDPEDIEAADDFYRRVLTDEV